MIDTHEMIQLERRLNGLENRLIESNTCITALNDKLDGLINSIENLNISINNLTEAINKTQNQTATIKLTA